MGEAMRCKETKYIDVRPLKFIPILNKEKKREIIEWLKQSCLFFQGLNFHSSLNIEISEEIIHKNRKILFAPEETVDYDFFDLSVKKHEREGYIYIIKSGNAFLWTNHIPFLNRMKVINQKKEAKNYIKETVLVEREITLEEIKKRGIAFEIFCKGDPIIPEIDQLYDYRGYKKVPLPGIPISVVSGTPFEKKCMEPLVLIRIESDELKKMFSSKNKFFIHLFNHISFKHYVDKWKLLTQWTNNTDIKILSILALYFSGMLPLQNWRSLKVDKNCKIEEEEMDIRGKTFEKPNTPITGFKVSSSELTMFIGLTRQTIFNHIAGKKSIFGSLSELTEIIKYESKSTKQEEIYKFSSVHPTSCHVADFIRDLIFSSLSITKF